MDQFLSENKDKLTGYCLKITEGNIDAANDLFQDAALKLLGRENISQPLQYFYQTAVTINADNKESESNTSLVDEWGFLQDQSATKNKDIRLQAVINVINSYQDRDEVKLFESYIKYGTIAKAARVHVMAHNTAARRIEKVKQKIKDEYNRLNTNPNIVDRVVELLG